MIGNPPSVIYGRDFAHNLKTVAPPFGCFQLMVAKVRIGGLEISMKGFTTETNTFANPGLPGFIVL